MVTVTSTPEDLLHEGLDRLQKAEPDNKTRRRYLEGNHELPFAPEGVNAEYEELQKSAPLPLIRLAVRTPVQRLKAGGVRFDGADDVDERAWKVWKANNLDARQRIVYTNALVYPRGGIVSVWPNDANRESPLIRPESPWDTWVEPNPDDPFRPLWAVKRVQRPGTPTQSGVVPTVTDAWVYTDPVIHHFQAEGISAGWRYVGQVANPLGRVPFVVFLPEHDGTGNAVSYVDPLIPMQRAIDALRFDLLLAAQFAAYRQRIIVGFDPVLRDPETGEPVYRRDEQGNVILDENGLPVPIIVKPGKASVDRFLVFPGDATNVFDLPESDLKNYVVAHNMLVATFSSAAQVPPQYLVGDFKNVSGDLMTATEATLRSFCNDLRTSFGEGWDEVFRLEALARGAAEPEQVEVSWLDAEPKSLEQIASAAAQMVPHGAPLEMFLEMMPGATPQMVKRWMAMSRDALSRAVAGDVSAVEYGPKPEADDGAAA